MLILKVELITNSEPQIPQNEKSNEIEIDCKSWTMNRRQFTRINKRNYSTNNFQTFKTKTERQIKAGNFKKYFN